MSTRVHDFSMFTTEQLRQTVEKYESMMDAVAEEHAPTVREWLDQAKEELTMRLIVGDHYADR